MERRPEDDGYRSLIIIKEGSLGLISDLMTWLKDWMPEHGYDSKEALMRNTPEGYYEIMAKPIDL